MKSDATKENFNIIKNMRIFFGHQSVGENIIDGVKDIATDLAIRDFQVMPYESSAILPEHTGFLLHSKIGVNTQPVTKCEDFGHILDTYLAQKIDMALLKFCYIDINENTDIQYLFEKYRLAMDKLISAHPDITFIHVTAPLRHAETGLGAWLREMLGKPNRGKMANIKRHEFNELLRAYYRDAPLFDLETSQSTDTSNARSSFKYKNDIEYPNLIADFTYDGGHLNKAGRRKVATDFISSLAKYSKQGVYSK